MCVVTQRNKIVISPNDLFKSHNGLPTQTSGLTLMDHCVSPLHKVKISTPLKTCVKVFRDEYKSMTLPRYYIFLQHYLLIRLKGRTRDDKQKSPSFHRVLIRLVACERIATKF